MGSKEVVLVDGANIAYIEQSKSGSPKVSNLVAVRKKLQEMGYQPIIIVDAALRHEIDDPDQLEALIDDQIVRQAPAGTDADFFILESAEEENAKIISNDEYFDYRDKYKWIPDRRVPIMIINGDVTFYNDELKHA